MTVTIRADDPLKLELFPENEEQDIIQNILCILKTTQGSCPGLRDYGINPEIMHKPIPIAKGAFSVSIQKQMELYEPRATLAKLEFDGDETRPETLIPILEVTIP
jgi:phage baseplate assembly protein W